MTTKQKGECVLLYYTMYYKGKMSIAQLRERIKWVINQPDKN